MKDYAAHPELKELLDAGHSPEVLEMLEQAVASAICVDGTSASGHCFDREPFLVPEGYVTLWEATLTLGNVYRELLQSKDGKLNEAAILKLAEWAALGFLPIYALNEERIGRIPTYCWGRLLDNCGPAFSTKDDLDMTMLNDRLTGEAFGALQGLRTVIAFDGILQAWRREIENAEGQPEVDPSKAVGREEQIERAARRLFAQHGSLERVSANGIGGVLARDRLGEEASLEEIKKLKESMRRLIKPALLEKLHRLIVSEEEPAGG